MLYAKKDLVEVITKNRAEHRAFFEKACVAYKAAVIEELEKSLSNAKRGRKIRSFFRFVEPEEHTKDYDRVLKMLSMTTQDGIELSEEDFARYVLDDWDWKQQFVTSNSTYMTAT